jgi:hypothetical protein
MTRQIALNPNCSFAISLFDGDTVFVDVCGRWQHEENLRTRLSSLVLLSAGGISARSKYDALMGISNEIFRLNRKTAAKGYRYYLYWQRGEILPVAEGAAFGIFVNDASRSFCVIIR